MVYRQRGGKRNPKKIPPKRNYIDSFVGQDKIEFGYYLDSRANKHRHWGHQLRENKEVRLLGKNMMRQLMQRMKNPPLPFTVHLTRIAPRSLDRHDNEPMAWKSFVDGCCEHLQVDDRTTQIEWEYHQEKPKKPKTYGIIMRIETRNDTT